MLVNGTFLIVVIQTVRTKGSRKNNFTFSYLIFGSSSVAYLFLEFLEIGMPLGYHEDVTGTDIRYAVGILVKERGMRKSISQNGKMLIDGYGVERIANKTDYDQMIQIVLVCGIYAFLYRGKRSIKVCSK